ncbi:hypothetical protein GCM10010199_31260 [Dactylosporangium roseum]
MDADGQTAGGFADAGLLVSAIGLPAVIGFVRTLGTLAARAGENGFGGAANAGAWPPIDTTSASGNASSSPNRPRPRATDHARRAVSNAGTSGSSEESCTDNLQESTVA